MLLQQSCLSVIYLWGSLTVFKYVLGFLPTTSKLNGLNGTYGFTVAKRDKLSFAERMLYHFSVYVTLSTILMKLHFFVTALNYSPLKSISRFFLVRCRQLMICFKDLLLPSKIHSKKILCDPITIPGSAIQYWIFEHFCNTFCLLWVVVFLGWASLATFDDLFQDEKRRQQTCESLVWNLVLIVSLFSVCQQKTKIF